ncbi:AAA family ATPase [Streptomyces sp. NPDC048419]|uniref:helix-turn-helix transcriptional regulator n=1 Tax=Streptomyces sp. NPDC048419 TaxID=3365547 RepID=UPI003716451E
MNSAKWKLYERELELRSIAQAVKSASLRNGSIIVFEGDSGIGKTRLLTAVLTEAAEAGLGVLSARGAEFEQDFPFGVVRQLFDPVLVKADAARKRALWAGAAGQARQVFDSAATSTVGDFAVLHGLFWLTANAADDRPLVVLIDDLQWCDVPSLRYLVYLAPRARDLGVLLAISLRSNEVSAQEHLIQLITGDPTAVVLHPPALSSTASALALSEALGGPAQPVFADACHRATGGNPLLLSELAGAIRAHDLPATAESADEVADLGPLAVARLVEVRLARLSAPCLKLSHAVAVLGDGTELTAAAALTKADPVTTLGYVAELERLQILRTRDHLGQTCLDFVHPLVRTAVYASMGLTDRVDAHRRAASVLAAAGASPDRVATHLLKVPPASDRHTVALLRAAAGDALRRGSADSAHTYLSRALHEPPAADQYLSVLAEAANMATKVDLSAAARYLRELLDLEDDPHRRAELAFRLGRTQMVQEHYSQALHTWTEALVHLPDREMDLRRRLQAAIVQIQFGFVDRQTDFPELIARLRGLEPDPSVGGRMIDCVLSFHDALTGDPQAMPRALRGIEDGLLVERTNGDSTLAGPWVLLAASDRDPVMASLDEAVAQAHRAGSIPAMRSALTYRGLAWFFRGALAEAEADLRRAVRAARAAGVRVARLFTGSHLADVLIEQGKFDEAAAMLDWIDAPQPLPRRGIWIFYLAAQSRLFHAQGQYPQAFDAALASGECFAAMDGCNPAIIAWRSQAALALHAMGRDTEAQELADDELNLARQWGTPRALGHALRISGMLKKKRSGLQHIQEAVTLLEKSPARLEYSHALTDLGAALRRAGRRTEARQPLRRAIELATVSGAAPLADRARDELLAAGARPRRAALIGPQALTVSERRVIEMAIEGATNRQIAQALFVTPKTVEVHLSSAYRKLGINARGELAKALTQNGGAMLSRGPG